MANLEKKNGIIRTNSQTMQIKYGKNNVPYLTYNDLSKSTFVKQAFSTREGGVSSGIYSSMNLTFNLDDSYNNVITNFRLFADAIEIPVENMIYSKQTHTVNIKIVDHTHCGMGIVRDRDFDNIDGLITNEANVCLVTSFADCIPVLLIDEKHHCIASVHSGWRGTVGQISVKAAQIMNEKFGSDPIDIKAYRGTGICQSCYEVSIDVARQFMQIIRSEQIDKILSPGIDSEHFQLDLKNACRISLLNYGIPDSNITVSDLCTCCNEKYLFSHRATNGKRGILCNFIEIKI